MTLDVLYNALVPYNELLAMRWSKASHTHTYGVGVWQKQIYGDEGEWKLHVNCTQSIN